MSTAPKIGRNRTGLEAAKMEPLRLVDPESTDIPKSDTSLDRETFWEGHNEHITTADPIGSVPIPPSFKGLGKTVLEKLKGNKPEVLIDKLGARLAFERSGTRLYDMLIHKCELFPGDIGPEAVDKLRHIRSEEAGHFHLIAQCMVEMGADPTSQTPGADINGVAGLGLIKVISDPRTSITQCLEAILIAELADHASWEMLVEIADNFGLPELSEQFEEALATEAEHAEVIKSMLSQLTLS